MAGQADTTGRARARAWWHLAVAGVALVAAACQPTVPQTVTGFGRASGSSPSPGAATRVAVTGDGTSMATASPSCWGILRDHPGAPSGIYWLYTPAMDRPAQFYCDMKTSGGGWVLVARGRNGWTFNPLGQGTPGDVRSKVSGSAAFSPASLDSTTIEELTNDADIAALSDGIRIERARNSTDTVRQQYVIFPRFHSWTWAWPGGQLLTKAVIDGATYTDVNTMDTYTKVADQTANGLAGVQGVRRMFTFPWDGNNKVVGFSYGRSVPGGSSSSTNALYLAKSGGYPLPFTRVWLRPRLSNNVSFPAIPNGGYPAAAKPYRLNPKSEFAPWGVTGLDHTNEDLVEPWNTNVLALRSGGGRMYVGGRFTGVRKGPSGAITTQKALAAFDLAGNWISTFKPVIAGHVWDLLYTADNRLIVAGDFTSINGNTDASGVAALDPVTGAVLTTFKARIRRADGSRFRVRALAMHGSTIYAAGDFNQLTGGTSNPITISSAVSFNATTGQPGTWRPNVQGGSVVRIRVNNAGTRVLMAGHFTTVNGATSQRSFAITDIGNGANSAGLGQWQPSLGSWGVDYQQAVADLGDRVLVGGSQHDTQVWDPNRTKLLASDITRPGGDTQAIEVFGTHAFVGCHCGNWLYTGTNAYNPVTGYRTLDAINLVGMWDTTTWTYDTAWFPASLKGDTGEGVWAIEMDAGGCLWVGGDLIRGAYSGNAATDWLGGFARFCPQDTTVPTAPAGLAISGAGSSRKLTWVASTDTGGGSPLYDVIRNGRVVAQVSGTTYTDSASSTGTKYTVRAVDARGNRSAGPAPVTA